MKSPSVTKQVIKYNWINKVYILDINTIQEHLYTTIRFTKVTFI